jgi:hypothetical protein
MMLHIVLLAVVAFFGAFLGAWYGWWKGTRWLGMPSNFSEAAIVLGGEYNSLLRRHQVRRRAALVVGWSLFGTVFGVFSVVFVALSLATNLG